MVTTGSVLGVGKMDKIQISACIIIYHNVNIYHNMTHFEENQAVAL